MKRLIVHEDHILSAWTDGEADEIHVNAIVFDARGGIRAIRSDYPTRPEYIHELLEELLLDVAVAAGLNPDGLEVGL